MTPKRLDRDVVQRKLTLMDGLLRDLEQLRPIDAGRLRAEHVVRHAVERILTQLVQLAVDVNAHLATVLGQPTPQDYRSSFRAAAEEGVLPDELAEALLPSVGLRNLLIHEYATIDLEQVAGACDRASRDYAAYVEAVASYLAERN